MPYIPKDLAPTPNDPKNIRPWTFWAEQQGELLQKAIGDELFEYLRKKCCDGGHE